MSQKSLFSKLIAPFAEAMCQRLEAHTEEKGDYPALKAFLEHQEEIPAVYRDIRILMSDAQSQISRAKQAVRRGNLEKARKHLANSANYSMMADVKIQGLPDPSAELIDEIKDSGMGDMDWFALEAKAFYAEPNKGGMNFYNGTIASVFKEPETGKIKAVLEMSSKTDQDKPKFCMDVDPSVLNEGHFLP